METTMLEQRHPMAIITQYGRRAGKILNILKMPDVYRTVELLRKQHDVGTQLTVTDIYLRLRTKQSDTSHDLSLLRQIGLVDSNRHGNYVYYKLDKDQYDHYADIITRLSDICTDLRPEPAI